MIAIPKNCLSAALNRWHADGGYLLLRKSAHSGMPHVLTAAPDGLQHLAPGATLGHPVQALMGFDGVIWERDLSDAPPVPLRGIVVGSWLLAAGATSWALSVAWNRVFNRRSAA